MTTETVSGELFARMLRLGAATLENNRTQVNDLNVFPIPDGDTGDNMYMTIAAGCDAAASSDSLAEVSATAARGMLLGARGNSGVILSRIFAGIAKGLEGVGSAGVGTFQKAMESAVAEAYASVSQPVEGTILTVLKDGVLEAGRTGSQSFEDYFETLCGAFEQSLERTPRLLSVLAEAGVVDSGGAGLVYIAQGMRDALSGKDALRPEPVKGGSQQVDLAAFGPDSVLEFGYCTEFLLRLQSSKVNLASFDESVIKDYLESAGDSLVFFRDDSIIKVHVHSRTPGDILSHCQQWGEFLTVKVENMTLQHHENRMEEKHPAKGPRKKYGIVTVASGEGLCRMFSDMGADAVIRGGQTMNPSAEDFLDAFDRICANTLYVLPNNSNIIMTARQAAAMYTDARVVVLPSKSIGQGYAVLGSVDFALGSDEIEAQARQAMAAITTAMVSRAIRDTSLAHRGDYIGFVGDEILSDNPERSVAALELCSRLDAGSYDVILLLKGADVPEAEAAELSAEIEKEYPCAEVVLNDTGQPVYDYIMIFE